MSSNDYLNRAINLHEQKLYSDAIKERSKAIELDSYNDKAYTVRGMPYYLTEQTTNAVEDLTTSIQLNPYSSVAYCFRGMCFSICNTVEANSVIAFDKPASFGLKGFKLKMKLCRISYKV